MKRVMILAIIAIFLLSGCEELKELYGIDSGQEEYIPLEEIQIEEDFEEITDFPSEDEIVDDTQSLDSVDVEEIEVVDEEVIEETVEITPEELTEENTAEVEEISEEIIEEEMDDVSEEVMQEKKDAKVLIVEETELVSLTPKASDPDADTLDFTYTTPINNQGQWQTDYGDAGEYAVTVTATDGQLSATKDVLIIVKKKEEVPTLDSTLPEDVLIEATEDSQLYFEVSASDLNSDPLTYRWTVDGEEVSSEESFMYEIDFNAAGERLVDVTISDGLNEITNAWTVEVANVNRLPTLDVPVQLTVDETQSVVIDPVAEDPDGDDLTLLIDSDDFAEVNGAFEWVTTYDDSGSYNVVVTVTDGEDTVSETVAIEVVNVNRPPVFEDIVLG